jgi:hypothetical protein
MNKPTSRWRRSTISFGPVGRLVWTVVLLIPILYAIFINMVFLVAAAIWAFILPMALRDVWRAVKNPDYEPPIVLPPDPPTLKEGESLHDRRPPRRW